MSKSNIHFIWTSATAEWWSGFVMIYNYTPLHDSEVVYFLFSHIYQELRVPKQISGLYSLELWHKAMCCFTPVDFTSGGQRNFDKMIPGGYLQVPSTAGQEKIFLSSKKIFSELQKNFHCAYRWRQSLWNHGTKHTGEFLLQCS